MLAFACQTPSILRGPPPAYDHRKRLLAPSLQLVRQRWPQLVDLAESGTLVAVPRPDGYVERRDDGYREPQLVLLVGTAHISTQSADDVMRVVAAVQPQNVVVELCASRSALLYDTDTSADDPPSAQGELRGGALTMGGDNLLQAVSRSVALGGRSALLLRLLLGGLSQRLSTQMGIRTGVEFRAARQAAEGCGAQIVLGDRPIEVTLRRAWDAMSWQARVSLFRELTAGMGAAASAQGEQAAARALERLQDDDVVSAMLTSMAERHPEAAVPLLHERDLYLAWSLKRSKAVNGTDVVVGVLGRGHMRGVCYALTHDSGSLRFRDLAGSRKTKSSKNNGVDTALLANAGRFAAETAVFAGLWWLWNLQH
jgi:pheromone shutdown protein TraB